MGYSEILSPLFHRKIFISTSNGVHRISKQQSGRTEDFYEIEITCLQKVLLNAGIFLMQLRDNYVWHLVDCNAYHTHHFIVDFVKVHITDPVNGIFALKRYKSKACMST